MRGPQGRKTVNVILIFAVFYFIIQKIIKAPVKLPVLLGSNKNENYIK